MREIKKVAVLGAGVMGSQIAAHLANTGIPSMLFDLTQELSEKGIQTALKLKPAPFYNPNDAKYITPMNYDDHIEHLKEADWIIEVIAERLDWKQQLFKRIQPYVRADSIVSSNTSGLLIKDMMQDMPVEFRKNFLVTHFFNPPRYMHLLEIIRGEETTDEVVNTIVDFSREVLGKGIVYAKDTVNFIANRIGVFGMMLTMNLAQQMQLRLEEVDKLTGPVLGRPKSATFRTADVVGLDTLAHVATSSYEKGENDERRDIFKIPDYLQRMIDHKLLGQKVRAGFFKKIDGKIYSINFKTLEYEPQVKVRFTSLKNAKSFIEVGDRIRSLAYSDDKAGKFIWEVLSQTLIYAANRIPEIADDIVNIDRAMRWGFGWELGPFEIWDALDPVRSVQRMVKEGKQVPQWVKEMLQTEHPSFYRVENKKQFYYSIPDKTHKPVPEIPKLIQPKLEGKRVKKNWSTSIYDIGNGVAFLNLRSVLKADVNPIDGSMLDMLAEVIHWVPANGFKGLIIGSLGPNFSVGANLQMILELSKAQNWKMLEKLSKNFQDIGQGLRFAKFPVVAAPFNLTLGGGFEISGATDKIVASAELYCGAVEVGVGLIPGAGGNLRVLMNFMDAMAKMRPGPFPPVQKAFETIGFAKVSTSAKEAVKLGYLKRSDTIVINPDHLIYEAKQAVLKLAEDYTPPEERDDLILPGMDGFLVLQDSLKNFVKQGKISEHDRLIGEKLAWVLCGGDKASFTKPVREQDILDLEREAFVSLCGEKLSQDRMEHMLKTGKPLRN